MKEVTSKFEVIIVHSGMISQSFLEDIISHEIDERLPNGKDARVNVALRSVVTREA